MIGTAGTGFEYRQTEQWQQTMTLAYIEIELGSGEKILHQMWTSNIGRVMWRPIVEISKYFAETGNT